MTHNAKAKERVSNGLFYAHCEACGYVSYNKSSKEQAQVTANGHNVSRNRKGE